VTSSAPYSSEIPKVAHWELDPGIVIKAVRGFALTSPYGTGKVLGQPLGGKSLGFVEIVTNQGTSGVGETYAGVYAPEMVEPTAEFLSRFIVGRALGEREKIIADLAAIPFLGRNGLFRSVASAIEIAMWDATGKLLERPVSALLGAGPEAEVPIYASGGSAAFSPAAVADDLAALLEAGHRAYKMRVGYQDREIDVQRVQVARRLLGELPLMLDAIMGTLRPAWDANTAIQRGGELSAFRPYWLEEPVHPEDVAGLARVRRVLDIPVATGEALAGRSEFLDVLEREATDIIQPDATHAGGISSCLEVAALARERGVRTAVHVWGSPVAFSANAQVAVTSEHVEYLEVPTVWLEISEEIWVDRPVLEQGVYRASGAVGLGVSLSDEVKRRYALRPGSGFRL
jgi:L-alanine-DL-glutamate epimerase-like enolase superfamily enzyme